MRDEPSAGTRRGVSTEAAHLRDLLHADRATLMKRLLPIVLPGCDVCEIRIPAAMQRQPLRDQRTHHPGHHRTDARHHPAASPPAARSRLNPVPAAGRDARLDLPCIGNLFLGGDDGRGVRPLSVLAHCWRHRRSQGKRPDGCQERLRWLARSDASPVGSAKADKVGHHQS